MYEFADINSVTKKFRLNGSNRCICYNLIENQTSGGKVFSLSASQFVYDGYYEKNQNNHVISDSGGTPACEFYFNGLNEKKGCCQSAYVFNVSHSETAAAEIFSEIVKNRISPSMLCKAVMSFKQFL